MGRDVRTADVTAPEVRKAVVEPKPRLVPCPDCGGRGVRSWGTDDLECDACNGDGVIADGRKPAA